MIWTLNGRCPCGGDFSDRVVEVRFAAQGSVPPLELEAVPQGCCETCGSRVYHASVLNRLELVQRGRR